MFKCHSKVLWFTQSLIIAVFVDLLLKRYQTKKNPILLIFNIASMLGIGKVIYNLDVIDFLIFFFVSEILSGMPDPSPTLHLSLVQKTGQEPTKLDNQSNEC